MTEMSPLRRRMIEDMTVRNLSPATQRSYVHAVAKFGRFFGRSPDKLDLEDVRAFQVHLVAGGISWPALNQTVCALRFLYGVTLAPASHGAVITPGLIPIFTLLLGRMLFRESVLWRQALGVVVSIVGLALVVGPAFAGDPAALVGDLLYATAALLWATYTILGRAVTKRFHVAAITCLSGAVGALVFLPLGLLDPVGFGALATASPRALAGLAYLGSLGTAVGFVLFYLGVQRIGSARASAYTVLVPLFGVSLTVPILGESLDPISLVGAAIVIGGLWLTQRRAAAAQEPAAAASAAAP